MRRQHLHNHLGMALTLDTIEAFRALEKAADERGWLVEVTNIPPPIPPSEGPLSLHPAGRQVQFCLRRPEGETDLQQALNAAWGFAVPLGFTPWTRYPLVGAPGEYVFHFFGPWRVVYDRLMSEGRGHLAWPSLCCAAQVDVGVWDSVDADRRFVQAQLHRVGRNCGAIDGIIGPRTTECIDTLGLKRADFTRVAEYLQEMDDPSIKVKPRQVGHVALPGRDLSISAFGGVKVTRTSQGATLTVDGPGRVILDVGEK